MKREITNSILGLITLVFVILTMINFGAVLAGIAAGLVSLLGMILFFLLIEKIIGNQLFSVSRYIFILVLIIVSSAFLLMSYKVFSCLHVVTNNVAGPIILGVVSPLAFLYAFVYLLIDACPNR